MYWCQGLSTSLFRKHTFSGLYMKFDESKQSAIYNHASDTGHNINFNNPEILTSDSIKFR